MPGLRATLSKHDLDFLNRTARFWQAEISQHDLSSALEDLCSQMLKVENLRAVVTQLSADALGAWEELLSKHGKIPWAVFSRKYGEIRDFGPARRERENPDLNPASVSEALWYAGLIGKAFLKTESDLVETAYIPDEICHLASPSKINSPEKLLIRPAINQKPKFIELADASLLDYLTDVLAGMRMGRRIPDEFFAAWKVPNAFMTKILAAAGLIDETGQPIPEALKSFFQASRSDVLLILFQAWMEAKNLNDLKLLPGLVCEGAWENDPRLPRRLLVDILSNLQQKTWWSLSSLITSIKEHSPDFQRSAGDYDSWFIREEGTETYLRGFEHWDEVEGRLLKYLVTGPLHWLGIVNLAQGDEKGNFSAFQLTEKSLLMFSGDSSSFHSDKEAEVEFKENATVIVPLTTSRELRYQVGRFCELSTTAAAKSTYTLTPASLKTASSQNLNILQFIQLLEKHCTKPIPAGFKRLALRWHEHGLEAEIKPAVLLKFTTEEACRQFMDEPKSKRFIAEILNSTTILIHNDTEEGTKRLLSELGILVQLNPDV